MASKYDLVMKEAADTQGLFFNSVMNVRYLAVDCINRGMEWINSVVVSRQLKFVFTMMMLGLCLAGCRVEVEPEAEPEEKVTTNPKQDLSELSGNWVLTTYVRDQEVIILMLEIKQENGVASIGIKEMAPGRKPVKLKSIDYVAESHYVGLSFLDERGKIFFKGILKGEEVRGIIIMSTGEIAFSRLTKTAVLTLEGQGKITEVPEAKDFNKALQSSNIIPELREFIKNHPQSHLVFKAYETIFDESVAQKKPEAELLEIFKEWKESGNEWGTDLLPGMYSKTIGLLGNSGYSLELLQQLEQQFQEFAEQHKVVFNQNESNQVFFGKALSKLNSKSETISEEGIKDLESLVEKNPQELLISYRILVHYNLKQNWEKVIEKAAPFLSLPLLEQIVNQSNQQYPGYIPPSNLFVRAWETLKKDNQELQPYLQQSYLATLDRLTGNPSVKEYKKPPLKPLLLELHTGISSEKCIAPELVCSQLQQKYGKDKVMVLRFHQHGELGDPLTQQEGEQRFNFLAQALGQKTGAIPMLFNNGLSIPEIGGGLTEVKGLYAKVAKLVDDEINQAPILTFKTNISVADELIKVEVKGDKIPKTDADFRFRLHMVLVEKNIKLLAANGILLHENVVRDMPFGPKGRPYTDETLNFSHEFDVKTLRHNQELYLQKYEKSKNGKFASYPNDMNELSVIVFIQSNATGYIVSSYVQELTENFGSAAKENQAQQQESDGKKQPVPPAPNLAE